MENSTKNTQQVIKVVKVVLKYNLVKIYYSIGDGDELSITSSDRPLKAFTESFNQFDEALKRSFGEGWCLVAITYKEPEKDPSSWVFTAKYHAPNGKVYTEDSGEFREYRPDTTDCSIGANELHKHEIHRILDVLDQAILFIEGARRAEIERDLFTPYDEQEEEEEVIPPMKAENELRLQFEDMWQKREEERKAKEDADLREQGLFDDTPGNPEAEAADDDDDYMPKRY
ncbi:MAG: hypothetical protein WCR70_03760 [Sphaerochaetaceae bacterium]